MDTTHIYIQDYRVGGWLGLVFSTSTIGLGGRHKTSTDTVSRSIPQWLVQGRAAGFWGWVWSSLAKCTQYVGRRTFHLGQYRP